MNTITRSFLFALIFALISLHAYAESVWDGAFAYDKGDYATAINIFKPLAEKGHPVAQLTLGKMYYFGQGVPQDYKEAVKWYRLAAEQGYADAQSFLGVMCFFGKGVVQDYVTAHKWANLAAANGIEKAMELRDDIAKKMTPEQISRAQALARGFVQK